MIPYSDPAFPAKLAALFPNLPPSSLAAQLLGASFILQNESTSAVTWIGVDFNILTESGPFIFAKTLALPSGRRGTHSGNNPIAPAGASVLVNPICATPQPAGSAAAAFRASTFSLGAGQQFLLDQIASASSVTLTVRAAVLDKTNLVGDQRMLQMRARVVQAAEHDLAARLRRCVNAGGTPGEVEEILQNLLFESRRTVKVQRDNRRIYSAAQSRYARILLRKLKANPHSFLAAVKSAAVQHRVNFSFYGQHSGESK